MTAPGYPVPSTYPKEGCDCGSCTLTRYSGEIARQERRAAAVRVLNTFLLGMVNAGLMALSYEVEPASPKWATAIQIITGCGLGCNLASLICQWRAAR